MTRGIVCTICQNEEFDKQEQKYGFRPRYLWNEPYTQTAYIKKYIKRKNGTYTSKWIKIGHYCRKCSSFYHYFRFPRIIWTKYKY